MGYLNSIYSKYLSKTACEAKIKNSVCQQTKIIMQWSRTTYPDPRKVTGILYLHKSVLTQGEVHSPVRFHAVPVKGVFLWSRVEGKRHASVESEKIL